MTENEKPKGILKKVTFQTDHFQDKPKEQPPSTEKFPLNSDKQTVEIIQTTKLNENQIKENANLKEQNRVMKAELEEAQVKIEQLRAELQHLKSTVKEVPPQNGKFVSNDLNRKYNQTLNENYNLFQEQEKMKREYETKLNMLVEENKKQKSGIEQLKADNNKLNVVLI